MPKLKEASAVKVIKKSVSMHDVLKNKYVLLPLSEKWIQYIGHVEENFRMIVYGESGGGKTTFVMELCCELTKHGKVYYNSAEEGEGASIQNAAARVRVGERCAKGSFMLGDNDDFDAVVHKLSQKRAARFLVIDSLQYMRLSVKQIQYLMETFKNKSIIVISWAEKGGAAPKGSVAKDTEYMFGVKTMVNNGSAVSKSRYGATIPYEVYPPRPKAQKEEKKKGRPAKVKEVEPDLFDATDESAEEAE